MKNLKIVVVAVIIFAIFGFFRLYITYGGNFIYYVPYLTLIVSVTLLAIPLFVKKRPRHKGKVLYTFVDNGQLEWQIVDDWPDYGDLCINWNSEAYNRIKYLKTPPNIFTYDINCASRSDELDFRRVICKGIYNDGESISQKG